MHSFDMQPPNSQAGPAGLPNYTCYPPAGLPNYTCYPLTGLPNYTCYPPASLPNYTCYPPAGLPNYTCYSTRNRNQNVTELEKEDGVCHRIGYISSYYSLSTTSSLTRRLLSLGMFFVQCFHLLHLFLGTHENRRAFMNVLRLNVQNALVTIRRFATGLLHDECHGVALIQNSQL